MPSVLPSSFTLRTDFIQRLTALEVKPVAKAFAEGKGSVQYTSREQGPEHRQWVEVQVMFPKGVYRLVFGVKEGRCTDLWVVLTPSQQVFCIDHEAGHAHERNPSHYLSTDQLHAITKRCLPPLTREQEIEFEVKRNHKPKPAKTKKK